MKIDRVTWQRAFGLVMLLAVVTAPTQWSMRLMGGAYLTAADLLVALALPLAVVGGMRPWRLPWPHLAFGTLTLLAAWGAADRREAVKEWLQVALYFLAGSALTMAALRHGGRRWLRRGVYHFLGAGVLIVGLALWQYWGGAGDDPLLVRGSFGNRNVLGGYLALLLPLAFGLLLGASSWRWRLGLSALLVAGFGILLSGAAWLAVALVCVVLAAWHGPRCCIVTCALLLAGFVWLLPQLPRANDRVLYASMALYDGAGQPTRRYPEWQAAANLTLEHPWLGAGLGGYQRHVGPFYGVVPNATGPAEPDIANLYLVLSASAGIPATLAFLAMLTTAMAAAGGAAGSHAPLPGLAAGLAGALSAFAIAAIWHPLLVRGLGLPLAMLLGATRYVSFAGAEKEPCH